MVACSLPPATCTQVVEPSEEIGGWNENYWLLRAEPIPADEESPAEGDTVIRVAHIAAPKQQPTSSAPTSAAGNEPAGTDAAAPANNGGGSGGGAAAGGLISTGPANAPASGVPFGDPFLLRLGPSETVGEVKGRIQEKLGVAAADFEAWKMAFVSSRGAPQYLAGEQGSNLGWGWRK